MGRREGGGEAYERFVLRFERVLDVLVELLVGACCLCGVEVAVADYVAVGSGEVKGGGYVVEFAYG